MNVTFLIVVLSLVAMLAVLVSAIRSQEKVDRMRRDAHGPGSSPPTGSPDKGAAENLN